MHRSHPGTAPPLGTSPSRSPLRPAVLQSAVCGLEPMRDWGMATSNPTDGPGWCHETRPFAISNRRQPHLHRWLPSLTAHILCGWEKRWLNRCVTALTPREILRHPCDMQHPRDSGVTRCCSKKKPALPKQDRFPIRIAFVADLHISQPPYARGAHARPRPPPRRQRCPTPDGSTRPAKAPRRPHALGVYTTRYGKAKSTSATTQAMPTTTFQTWYSWSIFARSSGDGSSSAPDAARSSVNSPPLP